MNISRVINAVQVFLVQDDHNELAMVLSDLYAIQCGWESMDEMCKELHMPRKIFDLRDATTVKFSFRPKSGLVTIEISDIVDQISGEIIDELTYTMDLNSSGDIEDVQV